MNTEETNFRRPGSKGVSRIEQVLRDAWDTSGGQALRSLLWSLHNDAVRVPLWTAISDLDAGLVAEFCELLQTPFDERGKRVERLLIDGEEWHRVRLPAHHGSAEDAAGEPLKWAAYGSGVEA